MNVIWIPGSYQARNVPLLTPGYSHVGTFNFVTADNSARVRGTFEAICGRRSARRRLTQFGLESMGSARDWARVPAPATLA
ncbi:MAG: hypothetical protein DYG94_10845 [Leptolyngbya sp. PLA3]|nr:MAG: hypothetical protein EDM82_08315 [Cyanobacteria bacterium CYA]MCE7969228.1 hypothetical protein [Leptolyngbya sp. PL-A3]